MRCLHPVLSVRACGVQECVGCGLKDLCVLHLFCCVMQVGTSKHRVGGTGKAVCCAVGGPYVM